MMVCDVTNGDVECGALVVRIHDQVYKAVEGNGVVDVTIVPGAQVHPVHLHN